MDSRPLRLTATWTITRLEKTCWFLTAISRESCSVRPTDDRRLILTTLRDELAGLGIAGAALRPPVFGQNPNFALIFFPFNIVLSGIRSDYIIKPTNLTFSIPYLFNISTTLSPNTRRITWSLLSFFSLICKTASTGSLSVSECCSLTIFTG